MQTKNRQCPQHRAAALAATTALAGSVLLVAGPMQAQRAIPDVAGEWSWHETATLTLPDYVAQALFWIPESEGPIMRVICESGGVLSIAQVGSSFTASGNQDSSCRSQGGQIAGTDPFPDAIEFTGTISGRSLKMEAGFGPITCSYNGALEVDGDVAVAFKTGGNCDVPAPFSPNTDFNRLEANRL